MLSMINTLTCHQVLAMVEGSTGTRNGGFKRTEKGMIVRNHGVEQSRV